LSSGRWRFTDFADFSWVDADGRTPINEAAFKQHIFWSGGISTVETTDAIFDFS
jgi:hypothetical protein